MYKGSTGVTKAFLNHGTRFNTNHSRLIGGHTFQANEQSKSTVLFAVAARYMRATSSLAAVVSR